MIAIEEAIVVAVITATFAFFMAFIQADFIMARVNYFKVRLKDTSAIFIVLENRFAKIQENFKFIVFILRKIQSFEFNVKVWIYDFTTVSAIIMNGTTFVFI